jgi:hypothetical protein
MPDIEIDSPVVLDETLRKTNKLLAMINQNIADIGGNGTVRLGYRRKKAESDPEDRIEYIYDAVGMAPAYMDYANDAFNYGDWEDFIDMICRPVMLKADGTVDYELDHNNHNYKIDGITASDVANTSYGGNAMAEFGKAFRWVKRSEDANYEYVIFSNKQVDEDYHAYAHTNFNGDIVDSFYYGMFQGTYVDSRLRSLGTGSPMASQTREAEISRAKANGTGFHTISWSQWNYISDLLTLISKSDDAQTAFGYGYANANSATLANGSMLTKGPFWGESTGKYGVKVFYIENYWGSQWQGIAGCILDGSNGIKIKMTPPYCDTPVSAADYSAYTATGVVPGGTSGNYISAEVQGQLGLIPKTMSGSSSTYIPDACWYNNGQVDYALVGGHWADALKVGSRCVILNDLASHTSTSRGSRLSYLPAA